MQIISLYALGNVVANDEQFKNNGTVSDETLEEAFAAARKCHHRHHITFSTHLLQLNIVVIVSST